MDLPATLQKKIDFFAKGVFRDESARSAISMVRGHFSNLKMISRDVLLLSVLLTKQRSRMNVGDAYLALLTFVLSIGLVCIRP